MSKFAILGVLFWIFGFMTLGYQAIKSFMGPKNVYKTLLIIDLLDPDFVDDMDSVGWHGMQRIADYLLTTPLYIDCFVVGTVLLIISSFFWKR